MRKRSETVQYYFLLVTIVSFLLACGVGKKPKLHKNEDTPNTPITKISCTSENNGAIRYTGTSIESCRASEWKDIKGIARADESEPTCLLESTNSKQPCSQTVTTMGLVNDGDNSCSVQNIEQGVRITCGHSTVIIPHGERGEKGVSGPQGSRGKQGERGETGPKGTRGKKGMANRNAGPRGVQGEKGETGERGDAGEIRTEKGERGAMGDMGVAGEKGETGPQGPQGPTGQLPGPQGPQGSAGAQGSRGELGIKRATSSSCPHGPRGGGM